MDRKLRQSERKWRDTGSLEDEVAYLRARALAGLLTPARLEIAALCGHRPAWYARTPGACLATEDEIAAMLDLKVAALRRLRSCPVASPDEERRYDWVLVFSWRWKQRGFEGGKRGALQALTNANPSLDPEAATRAAAGAFRAAARAWQAWLPYDRRPARLMAALDAWLRDPRAGRDDLQAAKDEANTCWSPFYRLAISLLQPDPKYDYSLTRLVSSIETHEQEPRRPAPAVKHTDLREAVFAELVPWLLTGRAPEATPVPPEEKLDPKTCCGALPKELNDWPKGITKAQRRHLYALQKGRKHPRVDEHYLRCQRCRTRWKLRERHDTDFFGYDGGYDYYWTRLGS